jgi:hypothetical protein
VWIVTAAGIAGCASGEGVSPAAPTVPAVETSSPAVAPQVQPEPWPPAGVVNAAREPATGPIVEVTCPPEGMPALDLLRLLNEKTGAIVVYDLVTNQKLKLARVQWVGTWRVPSSRLVDAVRAALHQQAMVMMPMDVGGTAEAYAVVDMNNPVVKTRPTWIPESEVYAHEVCDGLYVLTTLRVRDIVDTARVRQALTLLTTQTASIGRVQDVPGGRAIVVGDFAPVVAAMKRVVDEINASAVPIPATSPATSK